MLLTPDLGHHPFNSTHTSPERITGFAVQEQALPCFGGFTMIHPWPNIITLHHLQGLKPSTWHRSLATPRLPEVAFT